MDKLVYLLLGPVGCLIGMAEWMAILARRRRRTDAEASIYAGIHDDETVRVTVSRDDGPSWERP